MSLKQVLYESDRIKLEDNPLSPTIDTILGDNGVQLRYDIGTGNPKTFSIRPTGINWVDNTNNHTTGLERIALVQTALASVELPPNPTTLKIDHTILLDDPATSGSITINGSTKSISLDSGTTPSTSLTLNSNSGFVAGLENFTANPAITTSQFTSQIGGSSISTSLYASQGGLLYQSIGQLQQQGDYVNDTYNVEPRLNLYRYDSGFAGNYTKETNYEVEGIFHTDTTANPYTISTNQNLVITADNIDLSTAGTLIIPSPIATNNLQYTQPTSNFQLNQGTTGGITNPILTLNQNDTASGSAGIRMYKNISTNGSSIGEIGFVAKTAISGNPEREYARIGSTIRSNTSGNIDGAINLQARINDTLTECMRINGQDSQIEIYQPLDLNDKDIVSSTGDIELNATSSTGNGKIILRPKEVSGTETISIPLTSSATDELVIEKSANATTFYQVGGAVANTNAQMRLGYGGLRMASINVGVAPTFGLDNASFQTAEHQFVGTNYNLTLPSAGEVNLINANLDMNGGSISTSTGSTTLSTANSATTGAVLTLATKDNVAGSGAGLALTGNTLTSASAGGNSGQHLCLTINGVVYKIALLNA